MTLEETDIKKPEHGSLLRSTLPLFMLGHFAHHLLNALPVPLLPFIRNEFGLDYTRSGMVITAFNISYGAGQPPAGWLSDRIGPRIMVTIGICGVGLAGLLVGFSRSLVMLMVFLALMGVLGGGYHPGASPMISASVEPGQRGRALGLHFTGSSFSFFLAPLLAAGIAGAWGWRGTFIGLSVPTVILGIVLYVMLRRRFPGRYVRQEGIGIQAGTLPAPGRMRRLATVIALNTLVQALTFSTVSFIPLFLVDHFGTAEGIAAASVSLIYSSGFWMSPLGGYLSDRWGRLPLIVGSCLLAGPSIYLLTLAPNNGLVVGALLVAIGVSMYGRQPVSETYIVENSPARHRSTILGIYFFGNMEGGGIMALVVGYLIDHLGFTQSLTIVSIALVAVTLICAALLRGSRER